MSSDIRIALVGVSGLAALLAGALVLTQPSLTATGVAEPWQMVSPVIEMPAPPEEPKQELIEAAAETPPAPATLTPDIADVVAKPPHEHPKPPTPDPSAKTPAFGDDFGAELPACAGQFATGRWSSNSPGTTSTFALLTADTGGPCESVQIGFDAVAPTVEMMRIPYLNYTVIRFNTDQVAMAPGPDALSPGGGLVTGVVAFQDSNGPAVLVRHPSGVAVAARSVVSSNSVTIEFRAAQDSDLTHDGAFGGEPYDFGFDGSPEAGLVVALATELEASGEIGVLGYARAPEATLVVRVWDGPVLVDDTAVMTEGPAYSYGRFWHTLLVPNGTYTVEVGWDSPSGDPDLNVWYSTEVTVIGNP